MQVSFFCWFCHQRIGKANKLVLIRGVSDERTTVLYPIAQRNWQVVIFKLLKSAKLFYKAIAQSPISLFKFKESGYSSGLRCNNFIYRKLFCSVMHTQYV